MPLTLTSWTGLAADGDWATAGNWTAGVPDANAHASITSISDGGTALTIGPVAAVDVGQLTINGAAVGNDFQAGANITVVGDASFTNLGLEDYSKYASVTAIGGAITIYDAIVATTQLTAGDVTITSETLDAELSMTGGITGTAILHVVTGSDRLVKTSAGLTGPFDIIGPASGVRKEDLRVEINAIGHAAGLCSLTIINGSGLLVAEAGVGAFCQSVLTDGQLVATDWYNGGDGGGNGISFPCPAAFLGASVLHQDDYASGNVMVWRSSGDMSDAPNATTTAPTALDISGRLIDAWMPVEITDSGSPGVVGVGTVIRRRLPTAEVTLAGGTLAADVSIVNAFAPMLN